MVMEYKEKDVSFVWNVINDFWSVFEDKHIIAQLWRGYSNVVDNLYYQLYQINLSKCIHTIQPDWISDWEYFIFDNTTQLTNSRRQVTGGFEFTSLGEFEVDLGALTIPTDNRVVQYTRLNVLETVSGRYNSQFEHSGGMGDRPPSFLTSATRVPDVTYTNRLRVTPGPYSEYIYSYKLPEHIKSVTLLRESPREVSYLPANTVMDEYGTIYLPNGARRLHGDMVYMPERAEDTVYDIKYSRTMYNENGTVNTVTPCAAYVANMLFPLGLAVDTVKYRINVDFIVNEDAQTIHFKNLPYPQLWGNVAIRKMTSIFDNFGCLIDYPGWDSGDYLIEVQGLWYAYWNGATISNIESGLSILMRAPFARTDGLVKIIDPVYPRLTGVVLDIDYNLRQIVVRTTIDENHHTDIVYPMRETASACVIEGEEVTTYSRLTYPVITVNEVEYQYNPACSVIVTDNDYIKKFTPLTNSVRVYDSVNFPNWWMALIGYTDAEQHSGYLDTNIGLDNGGMDSVARIPLDDCDSQYCMDAAYLEVHTFLVDIDYHVWLSTASEIRTVTTFLSAIKPAYTDYILRTAFVWADGFPLDGTQIDDTFGIESFRACLSDTPWDHNNLDEEWIHPLMDDDSTMDTEEELPVLIIENGEYVVDPDGINFRVIRIINPTITTSSTYEGTQTTDGLVITCDGADDIVTLSYKITEIENGLLFKNNGTTPILNNDFITAAEGALGLKFTPTSGVTDGSFYIETARGTELDGGFAAAIVSVLPLAHTPSITSAVTDEDVMTTSGLVVTCAALNTPESVCYKVTSITNGTLFQHDGATPIVNNEFITGAEGAVGLKFQPTPNSSLTGSFNIQASLRAMDSGLGGDPVSASIIVTSIADTPSFTDSTTEEEVQTTTGLVITRNPVDDETITHFQIDGIVNGTLYQNDGITEIVNGEFITCAEGGLGLKFTPSNGTEQGIVSARASKSAFESGVGGNPATAYITINIAGAPAWSETNPAVVLAWMQATFNKASTGTPSMDVTPIQISYSYMSMGGNLAPNGLAFSTPYTHGSVQPYWYDYSSNTETSSGVHMDGYAGGVLLPNGLIMWVPKDSRKIILVDPVAKTYTEVLSEISGYFGGVYAANGKVVLAPYLAAKIGLYDYASGVFTEGPTNTTSHRGAVRAADGKIILMPFAPGGKIGIYDPVANSYTEGPAAGGYYTGGRLLPNGKILMVPDGSTGNYLGVYDPVANTFVDGPTLGEDSWVGSVMCPDGKVAITNTNSANIGIYNSADNTVAIIVAPQTKQWGGTLLPNGKVILWSWQYETQVIVDPACGTIPIESLLTPWINHL